MRLTGMPVYVGWLVPLLLVVIVVVTAVVVNRIDAARQPQAIVVKVTDGPTVLSTQVVRLDGGQ